jgi:hypothetical protein
MFLGPTCYYYNWGAWPFVLNNKDDWKASGGRPEDLASLMINDAGDGDT